MDAQHPGRGRLGCLALIVLVAVGAGFLLAGYGLFCAGPVTGPASSAPIGREAKLVRALAYLDDRSALPEIAWVEVEGNNVYVGWRSLSEDWQNICRAAAANGSRAIGFGCHVWAVPADRPGWRPGDGPYFGEFTVRHGRPED